jgi:hypothetical protein
MAAHHYVSKFHLREFCNPESMATPDPWLWVGSFVEGSVKRRSPKNVGTAPDLFDGPGGLADSNATIEDFLANEVEGPASPLTRTLALVGRNDREPWSVTPSQVNAILAAWAHDWIAGPTSDCVADAIRDRKSVYGPANVKPLVRAGQNSSASQ